MIPVKAVRIEPLDDLKGYFAVDGEPCTRGSAFQVGQPPEPNMFQVYSKGLSATVVARDEVKR